MKNRPTPTIKKAKTPLTTEGKTIRKLEKQIENLYYFNQELADKIVTDYHDFSHPGTDKDLRNKLSIGDIYINAAICNKCNWFVRSRNRHDNRTCKCGAVSVDGGSNYCKRTGNPEDYTNVIVMFQDLDKKAVLDNFNKLCDDVIYTKKQTIIDQFNVTWRKWGLDTKFYKLVNMFK